MTKWKSNAFLIRGDSLKRTLGNTAAKLQETPIFPKHSNYIVFKRRETPLEVTSTATDCPCGTESTVHVSQQQSRRKKLVSFASLSAISRTFNPLSKVLFTFPSRYLFAIGLGSIFSFRRKLPPILRSISKERDSLKPYRTRVPPTYTGFSPSLMLFSKKTYAGANTGKDPQDYNSETSFRFTCWALPGSIAFTKGIIFIFFSSAYLYA